MTRIFDNYIIVDWSASSKPNSGSDSIWIGILKRDARRQMKFEHFNPSTRLEAFNILVEQLNVFNKRGDKSLLGFDFAIGYPNKTAEKLKLGGAPWSAMIDFLAKEMIDKPDNDNNRFQVASKMNRLMSNSAAPFWACPPKFVNSYLGAKKPDIKLPIDEMRLCDIKAKTASSVFKLYSPGSVGSQSLTGIPYVKKLRQAFEKLKIWPFETGLKSIERDDLDNFDIILCEIYPSMLKTKPEHGETKDLAQVRALSQYFAELDEAGKLRHEFAGAKDINESQKSIIENEEGYILGI